MTATQPNTRYMRKLNYSVLLEQQSEHVWTAIALGGLDCKAQAPTREQALEALQQIIQQQFAHAEVVQLEVELPSAEHPWMKFAGMFKDDPYWDEFLDDIAAYRHELDAEMLEQQAEDETSGSV